MTTVSNACVFFNAWRALPKRFSAVRGFVPPANAGMKWTKEIDGQDNALGW